MNEIKLEIGDNLKEVMLELIKLQSDGNRASFMLYEAFGIDFSKILKGLGRKIQIIAKKELGPPPTGNYSF